MYFFLTASSAIKLLLRRTLHRSELYSTLHKKQFTYVTTSLPKLSLCITHPLREEKAGVRWRKGKA